MKKLLKFFLFASIVGAVSLFAQGAPTTVFPGNTVKFSVTVDGTAPFTYVWQKAAVGTSTFVTISGQTGSIFTIPSATVSDAGTYRVIVSNGGGSTTSDTASLTQGSGPTIRSFGVQVIPPVTTPST